MQYLFSLQSKSAKYNDGLNRKTVEGVAVFLAFNVWISCFCDGLISLLQTTRHQSSVSSLSNSGIINQLAGIMAKKT